MCRRLIAGLFFLASGLLCCFSQESSEESSYPTESSVSDSPTASDRIATAIENAREALKMLRENSENSEIELQKVYDTLKQATGELEKASEALQASEAQRNEISSLLEQSKKALTKLKRQLQLFKLLAIAEAVAMGAMLVWALSRGK